MPRQRRSASQRHHLQTDLKVGFLSGEGCAGRSLHSADLDTWTQTDRTWRKTSCSSNLKTVINHL